MEEVQFGMKMLWKYCIYVREAGVQNGVLNGRSCFGQVVYEWHDGEDSMIPMLFN